MLTNIMRFLRLISILTGIVLAVPAATVRAVAPAPTQGRTYKILRIMSYHSPWRWTDGQLQGFKEGLQGLPAEYKVFQMDTKRNSTPEAKERVGQEARALLAEGRNPSSIPMKPTMKGLPVISLATANKLGLRPTTGVLLSAEVIKKFDWDKQ